jgi:hypothetical protein
VVFLVEFEVGGPPVLADVGLAARLGDGDDPVQAERPGQRHLGGGGLVFRGDLLDDGVVEDPPAGQRRVRDQVVVVLDRIRPQPLLLEVRVEFDLVGVDRVLQNRGGLLELAREEVRDTDPPDQPLVGQFLEGTERLPGLVGVDGPVDVQQVDVVGAEPFQALACGRVDVVVAEVARVDFGGEKDVLAVDVGRRDTLADGVLVAVGLCGVDVAIPFLQRRPDAGDTLVEDVVLPGPEPGAGRVDIGHLITPQGLEPPNGSGSCGNLRGPGVGILPRPTPGEGRSGTATEPSSGVRH